MEAFIHVLERSVVKLWNPGDEQDFTRDLVLGRDVLSETPYL